MGLYDRIIEGFAGSRPGGWLFLNVFTHIDRFLIRTTGGRLSSGVGSRFHRQALVLTTTGAKSGKPRDVPLLYVPRGDDLVVIASATGQAKHPAWYYNLRAHPEAVAHVGGRAIPVVAREAEGEEREALWQSAVSFYSQFDTYRNRASQRRIPVMVLSPRL
jgi:deazaflavin-dependent oxidoreductase (nitroreductase family)